MKISQCIDSGQPVRRVAFFAGSFDPFTVGHEDIVRRALPLFDEVVVGIGVNPDKPGMMSHQVRKQWIETCLAPLGRVRVVSFTGLAVDAARDAGACCFVKGVRSVQDYEYEMQMAQANRNLGGIETVLMFTSPHWAHVSSSLVRQLSHHGCDVRQYLPALAPLELLSK